MEWEYRWQEVEFEFELFDEIQQGIFEFEKHVEICFCLLHGLWLLQVSDHHDCLS